MAMVVLGGGAAGGVGILSASVANFSSLWSDTLTIRSGSFPEIFILKEMSDMGS